MPIGEEQRASRRRQQHDQNEDQRYLCHASTRDRRPEPFSSTAEKWFSTLCWRGEKQPRHLARVAAP
jgi:hypothetical protein